MTPRVRGLQACMDALKGAKPDILDITITYHSYTGEVPTWDMGICVVCLSPSISCRSNSDYVSYSVFTHQIIETTYFFFVLGCTRIGYARNVDKDVPNLIAMLRGKGCPNVHMHLERHSFDDAMQDVEVWTCKMGGLES